MMSLCTYSLHHLHVVAVVGGAVQTTTLDSTKWYLWPGVGTVYLDPLIPGTVVRAYVRDYTMNRHQRIVLGRWSTAEEAGEVCHG
jgi:hypothetical protein